MSACIPSLRSGHALAKEDACHGSLSARQLVSCPLSFSLQRFDADPRSVCVASILRIVELGVIKDIDVARESPLKSDYSVSRCV